MKLFFLNFFSYLFLLVVVLVSVAFLVLLERKILGYIQIRKGPNKVGVVGILQSFGDAIKLFVKEQTLPLNSNLILFYLSPVLSLFIMLLLWICYPVGSIYVFMILGVIFFFCCTSFGVYTLMYSGWSSNSRYSLLGAMRGVAQTISYEVRLALIFISFIFLVVRFNFNLINNFQVYIINVLLFMPLFFCWLGSVLAETNRTPFDFSEGESELVSGFNIEYGRGGFAFLFLSEYGRIIFISYIISLIFFSLFFDLSYILLNFLGTFFCCWFIWVRGTLPRFRYDKLIYLAWKRFLPISLRLILFVGLVKVL